MKNRILIFQVIMALIFFSACSVEEPERSTITDVTPFSIASVDSPSLTVAEEDMGTYTVNFTIDDNLKLDGVAHISIDPSSTATADVDYHLVNTTVALHPYQTDYSFSFDVYNDVLQEGSETVIFNLTTAAEPFFRDQPGQSVSVTITDFVTDALYLGFNWDVSFEFGGDTYTTCPFVDIDVYVLDDMGNDTGNYAAATGACPESMVVDDTWADGEYFLASNMWNNATLKGLIMGLEYTMTWTGYRQGKIDFTYSPTDNWISDDDDQEVDGNTAFKEVGKITVAGNTYTLTAPDGTVIASGFKAPHRESASK